MLYATTRSKVATYTAQRALKEERAPDGGFYIPTRFPYYDRDTLLALLKEQPSEIIARILNEFFRTDIGRLDVEFAVDSSCRAKIHRFHRSDGQWNETLSADAMHDLLKRGGEHHDTEDIAGAKILDPTEEDSDAPLTVAAGETEYYEFFIRPEHVFLPDDPLTQVGLSYTIDTIPVG